MLSVTNDFKTAISQTGRTLDITVTINGTSYTTDSIVSLKYEHGVLTNFFEVGQVPSAYLEVTLKGVSANVDNTSVTASIGVMLPSGLFEYASLGTFKIDESVRNKEELIIKCFDKMVTLDTPFTSTSTSLQTIINEIVGVGVITLPTYLTSLTVPVLQNRTKRQVLGYIASLCGGNIIVDRNNVFKLINFTKTPSTSPKQTITSDVYFEMTKEDKSYNITSVTLTDGVNTWSDGTSTGNDLYIESPYAQAGISDDILTLFNGMPSQTFNVKYNGNPSLELCDNISISEFISEGNEVVSSFNIGSIKLEYDGALIGYISNIGEGKQLNTFYTSGTIETEIAVANKNATDAQTTANNALTSANGKNNIYYQTTAPTGTFVTGDTWFDTDDGNKIYRWNGSAWTASQLGTNAISNLSITNALIADGTIDNAKIANLDAGKITAGTLNANRIGASSITVDKLQVGDFTNLCQINADGFTKGYTVITHTDNYKYFRVGQSAYSRIEVIKSESTEFKVNDEYFLSFSGWKDSTITGSAIFYARYYYTDYTYNNAGVVSLNLTTTLGNVSAKLKITSAQTAGKTLDYVVFCLEKDATTTGYFYSREIEVRKRYNGSLIVDGSITATNIASNTITANEISAGTITSNEISAGTITADKLTIGLRSGNLIPNNFSLTGTTDTWTISGGTITTDTFNGGTVNVFQMSTSANWQSTSDYIEVDASLSYEFSMWIREVTARTVGNTYMGIYAYDANKTLLTVTPVSLTGTKGTATNNYYWLNSSSWGTTWKRVVGYAFAFDTNSGWNNGENQSTYSTTNYGNCVLPSNTRYVRLRFLNYNNAGTTSTVNFYNPQIAPVSQTLISGDSIKTGTIDASKIIAGSITANEITTGTITANEIAGGTILGTNIFDATIMGTKIADATITGAKIAGTTITASNIANTTITGGKIALATITGSNLVNGTITGTQIAASTITGSNISTGTITATQIADSTITATEIANSTITGGKIASATITGANISAGTITGSNILDATITATEIANSTITGGKIASATITGSNLVDATITGAKIAGGTITGALIADATLTGAKIQDAAITTAKIGDAQITSAKISSLDAGKVTTGTLIVGGATNSNALISVKKDATTTSITIDNTGITGYYGTSGISSYDVDTNGTLTVGNSKVINGCSVAVGNGTSVTITFPTTQSSIPFAVGTYVTVRNTISHNGTWSVSSCSTTTVTISCTIAGTTSFSGTVEGCFMKYTANSDNLKVSGRIYCDSLIPNDDLTHNLGYSARWFNNTYTHTLICSDVKGSTYFEMASGEVTITPSAANTPTSATVTLPSGRFSTAPKVVATANTTVAGTQVTGVGTSTTSTTSVLIYLTRTNTTSTGVRWVAMNNP